MIIEHAQDAELGKRTLIAVINPLTGRQVVNLRPELINSPLIALQAVGSRWIDKDGHEWTRTGEWWTHYSGCVCKGARALP